MCNLLGLVNLVYYAENYPSDLDDLLQLNRDPAMGFSVAPTVARVSFMLFTLLSLGKKQTTWYPTFVTYPMWNYDWAAYEASHAPPLMPRVVFVLTVLCCSHRCLCALRCGCSRSCGPRRPTRRPRRA